jgi:RNA polymerase sigma-70 factor, ECF subfamily
MSESSGTAPRIVDRPAQPYVAFRRFVTFDRIPEFADHLATVAAYLGRVGQPPGGPPFFKYNVIDMQRGMELEGGFPVTGPVPGDGEYFYGELPAGRYATVVYHGSPEGLMDATRDLLDWAGAQGLEFDHRDTPDGDIWACRLEVYRSDPRVVPDWNDWDTELVFKLAD